jgi:hypothetical protein
VKPLRRAFVATLTHARLRAVQGDVRGARCILERILERDPEHAGARLLLLDLDGLEQRCGEEEPSEPVAPPRPGEPREMAARFRQVLGQNGHGASRARIRRLERWLAHFERRR